MSRAGGSRTSAGFEERSAGAVLVNRKTGLPRYLLLKYPAGHWDLPKGNIEKGEEPIQTMKREVREETGIVDVDVFDGFEHKIEYNYMRGGRRIHKTVVFFLAETDNDKVTISFEHQEYGWFRFDEALRTVTYSNAKRLIRAAEAILRAPKTR